MGTLEDFVGATYRPLTRQRRAFLPITCRNSQHDFGAEWQMPLREKSKTDTHEGLAAQMEGGKEADGITRLKGRLLTEAIIRSQLNLPR